MEYPSLDKPTAGAFRFNTDSSQLEIYDGNQWTGVLATSPEQQTGGTRGLFCGGDPGPAADHNVICYVNIDTTGDAIDFGDLTQIRNYASSCASPTRGIWAGGNSPADASYDIIDYVEIATTGNAVDFGNLVSALTTTASCSNGHGGL